MAIVHILDKQTDDIIGTLDSKKGEFYQATRVTNTENKNTFDFTALKQFEKLDKRNRLLLQDRDGFFREYIIFYAEQPRRSEKIIKSDASFIDLNKAKVIPPGTWEGQTAQAITETALNGTEWLVGEIEFAGSHTITTTEHMNVYSFLLLVASTFEMELRFRTEVKGNKIVGRYVDLMKERSDFEGKEIVFGKDLVGLRRIEDSSNIITALIGFGPEKQDGTRLEVTVENQEALVRWGRQGKHLIDFYIPESSDADMTIERLTTLTENELQKRIDAIVSYECTAASLEHIAGHSHEKIRDGRTVRIKDDGYFPPLYLEARIQEIEDDPVSKEVLSCKIGNFIEYKKVDLEKRVKFLKDMMADKLSKLILASVYSIAGNVFKNGMGSTTLTAKTFLGGIEVDVDGSKYTYQWTKYDENGAIVSAFSKTGKSIVVTSSEIDVKATYSVEVLISEKISQVAQITITNVSDGAQGPQGPVGIDGRSSYTHIAYANSDDGVTGFSTSDSINKLYIGMYVDFNATDSTNPASYNWTLIKGADGSQGIQGPKGDNGLTPYLHIAYATNSLGTTGFSTTDSVGKTYIGQYTDYISADSTDPTKYTWQLVQGPQGPTGAAGSKGDTGAQGPQGPAGKDGIAYMGTTAPSNPATNSTWFQTDSSGKIIAIQKWTGSAWTSAKMDGSSTLSVANLAALSADLGNITAGNITGVTGLFSGELGVNGGAYKSIMKNDYFAIYAPTQPDPTLKDFINISPNGISRETTLWDGSKYVTYQFSISERRLSLNLDGKSYEINLETKIASFPDAELVINKIRQNSFTAPSFQNFWVNYAAGFEPVGFMKDKQGFVQLKGRVKAGSIGIDKPMFRLSSGYIPANARTFAVPTDTGHGVLFISNVGDVSLFSGSNGWVSLDGISFYVG